MSKVTIKERQVFIGGVSFIILPDVNGGLLPVSVTPSVLNATHFIASSTVPITVTNFRDGADYQEISILGDGFTSIAHNASIKTNTGALKLLAANVVYHFTRFNNVWYEDA